MTAPHRPAHHKVFILTTQVEDQVVAPRVEIDGRRIPGVIDAEVVQVSPTQEEIIRSWSTGETVRTETVVYDLRLRIVSEQGAMFTAFEGGGLSLVPPQPTATARDADGRPLDRRAYATFLRTRWENNGQVPERPRGILGRDEALVVAALLDELAGAYDGEPLGGLAREAARALDKRANR